MSKACLVIIFNHRYDKNIPVLEKIYGERFSRIFFLVPFYDGSKPNVIPVYESSHYFQSFFAQAYHRFADENYSHYIFIGDDCLLNPAIDENNFEGKTGLPESSDFIPALIQLHELKGSPWWHAHKGVDFFGNRKGAEIKNELPSREDALERFRQHGMEIRPLTMENLFGSKLPARQSYWKYWAFRQYYFRVKWKKFLRKGKIELPYPVAGSYSDILIIRKETLFDFCRYCGIMAAAGLFVELAIPTALLLSSKKIAQEKDLALKGQALWSSREIEEVETKFSKSLKSFQQGFPKNQLFYHPVKLSKWTNDL